MRISILVFLGLVGLVVGGIYPAGHFDVATELKSDAQHDQLVQEAVNGDHTLFIRWIASEG
jgi:hypothetical protein